MADGKVAEPLPPVHKAVAFQRPGAMGLIHVHPLEPGGEMATPLFEI